MLSRIIIFAAVCASTAQAGEIDSSQRLNELVERWYDESLELNPIMATYNGVHDYDDQFPNFLSQEYRDATIAMDEQYLEAIETIDPSQLEGQDLLSWEIFRRDRLEALAGARFPDYYLPVNQMFSVPIFFVQLGSPSSVTPFETAEDYDEFLSRIDGFAVFMDQCVTNMREGAQKGITLPQIIVDKTLPILAGQVVDDPTSSLFYAVVNEFPESIDAADQERLRAAYLEAIDAKIIPSYAKLHDFLRDEYREQARESTGWGDLPGGEEWYRFSIAQHTTTSMTAREIHEIGLREVARIDAEIAQLAEDVGFEGDAAEFQVWVNSRPELKYASQQDVLDRYDALRDRVDPNLDKLFLVRAKADFEIRPIEAYREAGAPGAHYQPASPDGSRPGIFYVNTGSLETRSHAAADALYLHEAVPGHHFQVSVSRELEGLPRFRRFNQYTAYVEGWGLYAESLGSELGLYEDPYQKLGQLWSERFRAKRLVVDTGLHAMGWTRAQALDYLPSEVEIDRYIVMPGQALAYKVGELKIQELRARAEERLGDRFDIREFHQRVLEDGQLPLDVLERKIDRWIDASLASG